MWMFWAVSSVIIIIIKPLFFINKSVWDIKLDLAVIKTETFLAICWEEMFMWNKTAGSTWNRDQSIKNG